MSDNLITKERIKELAKESLEQAAEMPKKKYAEPAEIKLAKKVINRTKLESDLYELLYAAGGQAPGYRRQLNKILDEHL
jgi:uncharacterized protein (DUF4415 family)